MPASPSLRPIRGFALLLALVAMAGPARADEARQTRAKQACAAGHVDEGIELLAALFAESGDVNYVYNQGRCYQQNGKVDQALNRFREYLRRATSASVEERREVEGFISDLERQREKPAATPAPAPGGPLDQGDGGRHLRTAGLTLAAVGAVAVGTGVVLSMKVQSAKRDVERY